MSDPAAAGGAPPPGPPARGAEERAQARSERLLTLPNAICVARLLLSPLMVVFAARDARLALVVLFVALTVSDWIDGKLAVLLDQRSRIGPQLDTVADAAMYGCLIAAAVWLDGDRLAGEWIWLTSMLGSWAVLLIAGLVRFGRWPALHTRAAKLAWGVAAFGAVAFLGGWAVWPLRLALLAVAAANFYALAVLLTLPEWRTDVTSLSQARRLRDQRRS